MARKSRYTAYMKAIGKREKRKTSPASILQKLKEFKEQKAVISIPIEEEFSLQAQGGGSD